MMKLVAVLSVLAATPVLLTASAAPVVTALAELWTGAVVGVVLLAFGLRGWFDAPLQVAAFETADPRHSPWPPLLVFTAAIAGLLSALISMVQVVAPQALQGGLGQLIQASHMEGRAAGHLRQPNHLATVLLWGSVAWAVLLAQWRMSGGTVWAGMSLLMAAVVASGSRTGLLGIALLAAWGIFDRRLPAAVRHPLMATPLLAAVCWWALDYVVSGDDRTLGATARLAEVGTAEISSARFAIWANTWELIQQQPWSGVGWGRFNIAWTLTPLHDRPLEPFGHPHNLPLQLMVELGVPMGLGVTLLLLGLLLLAARRAWGAPTGKLNAGMEDDSIHRRGALVMLGIVGLHSLLEYPLGYAYLGLPAMLALAVCLGWDRPWQRAARWQALLMMAGGAAMLLCSLWAYADYRRISRIFSPQANDAPLAQRIEEGQSVFWFVDYAHYAKAITLRPMPNQPWDVSTARAFERAPRVLLDPRLMMAWAEALAARNGPDDRDRARHLATCLRESQAPDAQQWLRACEDPQTPPHRRFICETPERAWHWRNFVPR